LVTVEVRHTASSEEVEALLARIREVPGYVYPFHTYMAEHDYSWLEAHQTWYEQIRAERWLPLKYKELLFLTSALVKLFETGIRTHIKKALEFGATRDEILETIEVAAHTGGGGVPVLAVRVLLEVLEDKELPKGPQWVTNGGTRRSRSRKTLTGTRGMPRERARGR
jgi:alkylhydroperoxidase/carboxymuconolactone decarboxylase family protein YurZ